MFACGQKLATGSENLSDSLENFCTKEAHRMSANSIFEFNAMIKSFGAKTPIRPLDLFDLKMSSGLSAFSMLVTYVVIILQFKIGEI